MSSLPIYHEIDASVFYAIGAAMAEAEPIVNHLPEPNQMTRTVDSCVHLLGSKQDLVYTFEKKEPGKTQQIMALFDGHGIVSSKTRQKNPYSGIVEDFNLTVLALQEMMDNKEIEAILDRDIKSPDDHPAIAMQRALGKVCIEKKCSMTSVGATMVVAKVTHDEVAGKIKVEVISTGDSKAVIYHNGKKVLDSVIHTPANSGEMERLKQEDRMRPWDSVTTANNFEVLDDMTVCPKTGLYVSVQNYKWAITQSVGHIGFNGKEVLYEEGMLGISPYIAEMEFSDSDEINVKLFSDGVGDVINEEAIIQDKYVMTYLNATATANLAAARWKQQWRTCQKANWEDSAKRPMILLSNPNFCFTSNIPSKNQADDVSCVSWIQTCK